MRTLSVGKDGFGGKLQYLQAQFHLEHINLIGLQETRTDAGMFGRGKDYLRIASGADGGNLGMETWVSLAQPFGDHRGRSYYVKPSQIVIVHGDPRRLLLVIHFGPFKLGVYNLHAPHAGHPEDVRAAWWEETAQILQLHYDQMDELFVLGDFNAKSGPCDQHVVFEHDDAESNSTPFMIDFLKRFNLCLPSTSLLHDGDHATWTTPDGQHTQRIDYIAVPVERLTACTYSTILRHVDLGHEGDHSVVGLDMAWERSGRGFYRRNSGKKHQYDRSSIKNNKAIETALRHARPAVWTTDIETQIAELNTTIHDTLTQHCPKPHEEAKKPFLTSDIMDLRSRKNQIKRNLGEAWRLHHRTILYRIFTSWKGAGESQGGLQDPHDVQHAVSTVRLTAAAYSTTKQIRKEIRTAKRAHIDKIVNEVPKDASSSHILALLRPVIGTSNSRKRKGSAMPYVLDKDGQPCTTPEAVVDRWVEHFGSMEGADRLSLQDQRDLWIQGLKQLRADDFEEIQLHDLPKLTDLEAAMRRVAQGKKAVGDDQVPPELCRFHAAALSKLVYPGLLKLFLRGQEDLTHKGGRLVTAYKRGPRNQCTSYRSLLISSHIGKCMHRALRCEQNSLYESFMQREQIGGRPRISVSVGLHMARAHHRAAKQRNKPSALLFLDLKEAYYRVLRPLALGSELTDQDVAGMVNRLHLPVDILHDLQAHLREADALQLATVPQSHRRYLQALHRDTHFRVDGQCDQCRTTVGSRPGDTFADIVFGYLWSRVLKTIEGDLERAGLLEQIPIYDGKGPRAQHTGRNANFLGPTWCDDLCICISAHHSIELEHKAGIVSGTLLDTCLGFGMLPNLDKGKTEIMLCFRGKGSKQLKAKYYGHEQGGRMIVCGEYGTHHINVVGEYKHLGGTLHHSGRLTKEIRRRLSMAHHAFGLHRSLLFQNPRFSLPKRMELFRSLVLSGLLYGTESWVPGSRGEDLHLHGAVMRLYKRILKCPPDSHIMDRTVCTRLGLASPTILLRVSRLRYIGQLYRSLPQDLWNVLLQDQEWIQVLEADIDWMWQQLSHSSELRDPTTDWSQWEYILQHHAGYWKRLVRRAMDHAIQQDANQELIQTGHQRILNYLRKHGIFENETQAVEEYPTTFGCLTCGVWFRSKAGEGAHMFRVHGKRAKVRTLYDATCTVCMKEYHTPYKLQAHLRYKRACRETLIARGVTYEPIPGKGSSQHRDQEQVHNGLLPVLQASGPTKPDHAGEDWEHEDSELHYKLAGTVLNWQEHGTRDAALLDGLLRAVTKTHPASWTLWCQTLRDLDLEFRNLMERDYHNFEEEVFTVLRKLADADDWPGLPVRLPVPTEPEDGHSVCARLLQSRGQCWRQTVHAPRDFTRHRVILHAFSGRRRIGDFQFYLDEFAKSLAGVTVHVISLDVVISPNGWMKT